MPSAEHMIHGMFLAYMHASDYFHVLQLLQILLLIQVLQILLYPGYVSCARLSDG